MPSATDNTQNNWIVILCVSSANRSKQPSRNNLNKENHYAALVSNAAGDGVGDHRCLSLGSIVRRQVEISMLGRSLLQRSPTECGVSECDRGTSLRRPGPTRGC